MRYLLLVVFCLFSIPAKANIISPGDYVLSGACLDSCDFLVMQMGVDGTGPAHPHSTPALRYCHS